MACDTARNAEGVRSGLAAFDADTGAVDDSRSVFDIGDIGNAAFGVIFSRHIHKTGGAEERGEGLFVVHPLMRMEVLHGFIGPQDEIAIGGRGPAHQEALVHAITGGNRRLGGRRFAKWVFAQIFANDGVEIGDDEADESTGREDAKTFARKLLALFAIEMLENVRGIDGIGGIIAERQRLANVVKEDIAIPGDGFFFFRENAEDREGFAKEGMFGEPGVPGTVHVHPIRMCQKAATQIDTEGSTVARHIPF